MALATLTSRVLGMVREMVYMRFMGLGWVNDAFQLAFMVPNLFRRLLGEGALTAAFIPVFKEKEKLHGEKEMWRASNAVISGLIVAACVIIAVVMLGISIALSVHQFDAKAELMLRLLRVMFPYMLLVCLTAAFMGMLNARGHFFIPAMGATMLNVVMITSVLWLAPKFGVGLPVKERLPVQIFALAYGVLAAGVAQGAFQMPTLWRDGFRYRWVSPWRDETVRRVVTQMIPGTIGVAAFQINVLTVQSLGFAVGDGVVAAFTGAVRLMELPQGMFGISLATFLLPTLSGLAAEKKFPEFRATLKQGIGYLGFVNLIAAAMAFVMAEPIVRLLFEHGKFHAADTRRVALTLMCLAPGLFMFSMVNILARAFYALKDITTPMKISITCLVLNLIFAAVLAYEYRDAAALAVANTLSATFNVWLLIFALRKKLSRLDFDGLWQSLMASLAAAILAGEVAYCLRLLWEAHVGHTTLTHKLGEVFVPMICGGLLYLGVTLWLKVPGAHDILAMLGKRVKAVKND